MKRRYLVKMVIFATFSLISAGEFIVKKERQRSARSCKEQACSLLFDTLSLTPPALSTLAQAQQSTLELVPSMLDDSFFSGRSKQELAQIEARCRGMYERQRKINSLMEEQMRDLAQLQEKGLDRTLPQKK